MEILCLGGCSGTGESLGLSPGEVRFEIVGLDQASLLAEAKVLAAGSSYGGPWPEEGAVIRLTLTRGDAAYLEAGDVCRGQLGETPGPVR